MNASCLDENGRFKSCPYRVYTDEHKAVLRGQGDFTYALVMRGGLTENEEATFPPSPTDGVA